MFLVGEARGAVGEVDYAAIGESVGTEEVLQHDVVSVGIDTQVVGVAETPVEALAGDAVGRLVGGEAVDNVIWRIVEPAAALDIGVGGVFSGNKAESGDDFPLVFHHKAMSCRYLAEHQFSRWIGSIPLLHVAIGAHKAFCCLENGHNSVDIACDGVCYSHTLKLEFRG